MTTRDHGLSFSDKWMGCHSRLPAIRSGIQDAKYVINIQLAAPYGRYVL